MHAENENSIRPIRKHDATRISGGLSHSLLIANLLPFVRAKLGEFFRVLPMENDQIAKMRKGIRRVREDVNPSRGGG